MKKGLAAIAMGAFALGLVRELAKLYSMQALHITTLPLPEPLQPRWL